MKRAKKAKTAAKASKAPVRPSAMRDLELLDPAAKQIKGGRAARDLRKRQRGSR